MKRLFSTAIIMALFLAAIAAMAATTHLALTNFTGGELSPLMGGRVDMESYQKGCKTLRNFIVYPHGPVTRRPGFRYIAEAKFSSESGTTSYARLIPFEFNTEQAYILEFGDQYLRVYMDQGQVQSGGAAYEIATPYAAGDLSALQHCQSADVMYLTHSSYAIRKLERTGHTAWSMTAPALTDVGDTTDLNDGANDYPSVCTFHENRLVFANTNNQPNTVFLSESGAFETFTLDVADTSAIEISLASNQVNAIQWVVSSSMLILGTTAGEWRLSAADPDDAITPTNITAKRELVIGSANHRAAHMGKDILFIQRLRQKIYRLAYDWQSAGYVAPNVTVLSEHIAESGVSELSYQQEPFSILWATRHDGNLIGFTFMPEHDVYAWHRHDTPDGDFESIACIPADEQDDLYAVINRSVSGVSRRYIEVMATVFDSDDVSDAVYLDSSLSYDGAWATVFSGVSHMAGATVYALADGAVISGVSVDAEGGVTLEEAASVVCVGLPYTSTLETMRLEAPTEDGGTSQGRIKRISKVTLRLLDSAECQVGPDEDHLADVRTGVSLFSGDKDVDYPGGYETDARIMVIQDDPLPLTLQAIIVRATTGE